MNTVSRRQLLLTFVPSLAILGAAAAACIFFDVSMPLITRDASALAHIPPLWGIVSNLGILLWCAAASIGIFAAAALHGTGPSDAFRFLLFSALLTAYLLFDDFFQFHENLAVHYLGLDERVVVAGSGIAIAAYLVAFKGFILKRTRFVILLLALGFFAASVAMDVVLEPWLLLGIGHWEYFLEDGAKLLGIACWCSYLAGTSHQLLAGACLLPDRASGQVELSADHDPSR
jgi:hypothetical protein